MVKPVYVHTPTCYVYENPYVTSVPLGIYSISSGSLTVYPSYYNTCGSAYRSVPVETPFSPAALALQGAKYPPTTMAVPNEYVYPFQYYGYGMYGRGIVPGTTL